jgi:hypothetical protein
VTRAYVQNAIDEIAAQKTRRFIDRPRPFMYGVRGAILTDR